MQILVVGGFGYIGSQVLDTLARRAAYKDADIVVVDNWSYGRGMAPVQAYFAERLKRMRSYCLDVSESESKTLGALVEKSDYVINVASLTQIPNSPLHEKYIVGGAETLARMIREGGKARKVIDISSTSVYGPVRTAMPEVRPPYAEEIFPDPAIALHNYAASKLRAERVWRSDANRGIPITVLRLSTVFGYAVGMRYNQFVNAFLVDAVAGRETVLPGAAENFRPHVHVADAAELIVHLLDNDPHTHGEVINVGARHLNPQLGELYGSLAALLREEFGIAPRYAFAAERGQETISESYQVDFAKFEATVGFRLRHDFASGARELVRKVMGG